MPRLTAEQRFHSAYKLAQDEIKRLQENLKKYKQKFSNNNFDYGHGGSVTQVVKLLQEINDFIG
ncbi:MAG: hypothetical protein EPO24_04030 [Bacteroidetes bacterium]|nr:MAG: hypothetical protein EPO24_04030 [Bacteroidota bacterium]